MVTDRLTVIPTYHHRYCPDSAGTHSPVCLSVCPSEDQTLSIRHELSTFHRLVIISRLQMDKQT